MQNISLLVQHPPIRLLPNASQRSPTLEIFFVALVAVCGFGVFPVALGERSEGGDSAVGDVVDLGDYCSGFCGC
jgi:hypothetical protein